MKMLYGMSIKVNTSISWFVKRHVMIVAPWKKEGPLQLSDK